MDELISVLMDIKEQLVNLNNKIDTLTGYGADSISDICGKLNDIDFSLNIINSSLDTIDSSLGTIDMTITMKD